MMPEMDGWEFCQITKDQQETTNVKIIMLTAKNQERDRMIGKAILKADEYMVKPFDVDELLATIRRLLDAG
jgi:DNA-binding response OmpR family regulator